LRCNYRSHAEKRAWGERHENRWGPALASLALTLALVLGALSGGRAVWAQSQSPGAIDPDLPQLQYLELEMGTARIKVKPGGLITVHPDTPFRVTRIETDSWLGRGLHARLRTLPEADLSRFHTLNELFGEELWNLNELVMDVLKNQDRLGSIRLVVGWLPIDFIRRANSARSLGERIKSIWSAWELSPDDRLLFNQLLDLLVEAGRYKQAAELMEGQSLTREDPALLAKLAELYMRIGQKDRAAAAMSKLLDERPRDPELAERLARLYQDLGRWEEAARLWERLVDISPPHRRSQVYKSLSLALGKAGRGAEALSALQKAAEAAPFNSELWVDLSRAQAASGQSGQAIASLERAVEREPTNRELLIKLGEALLAADRKGEAVARFEQARRLGGADYNLLLKMADIYDKLGDRSGLLKVHQQMQNLRPDDREINYNLGALYWESGEPAQALEHLKKARNPRKPDRELDQLIFSVLVQLGHWKEAVELAGALVKAKPDDLEFIELLYQVMAGHRPGELAELLAGASESNPKAARLYEMRAALALDAKQREQAATVLEQAVKALPDNLEFWRSLAPLYEALGRTQQAMEAYARILELKPDDSEAQERYLQLKTGSLTPRSPFSLPESQPSLDPGASSAGQ
jgi:tetratricopeptide (TPR) repeat protein